MRARDDRARRRRRRAKTDTMARDATTTEAATSATTTRGHDEEKEKDPPPFELVVLDFDLTVLSIHSFATRVRAEDVRDGTRDWVEDFVDLKYLERFYGAS